MHKALLPVVCNKLNIKVGGSMNIQFEEYYAAIKPMRKTLDEMRASL